MLQAVDGSYATSTDLADWLVKKLHYPFRQAYQITGKIVRLCKFEKQIFIKYVIKRIPKI